MEEAFRHVMGGVGKHFSFCRRASYKEEYEMKKEIFMCMMMAVLCVSCATKLTPSEKTARQELQAKAVLEALENRNYTIGINYVYPRRGPGKTLEYGYDVTVRNDSLISYLPYFGRAYRVPYGGGTGLNFSVPISRYQTYRAKKNMTRVLIGVKYEEDVYQYQLDVYDNGQVSLNVTAQEREGISFTGEMNFKKH